MKKIKIDEKNKIFLFFVILEVSALSTFYFINIKHHTKC